MIFDLKQLQMKIQIRQDILLLRSVHVKGHCSKFGYALWVTAVNLVSCFGPLRQIWLCGIIMSHVTELLNNVLKLVVSFKGTRLIKSVCIYTVPIPILYRTTQVLSP
jgi:hypothetical protein